MTDDKLLAFNPGSSSINLVLFALSPTGPRAIGRGTIDLRKAPLTLHVTHDGHASQHPLSGAVSDDLHAVIAETLDSVLRHFDIVDLSRVGHRVVHGGDCFTGPAAIKDETLMAIEALVPLAPLHQPQSVRHDPGLHCRFVLASAAGVPSACESRACALRVQKGLVHG